MKDIIWQHDKSVYSRRKQWSVNADGVYKSHSFGCIESGDAEWIMSADDYKERFFTFAGIHINNQDDADLISSLCENEHHKFEIWISELFNLSKKSKVKPLKPWFDYFVDGDEPLEAVEKRNSVK